MIPNSSICKRLSCQTSLVTLRSRCLPSGCRVYTAAPRSRESRHYQRDSNSQSDRQLFLDVLDSSATRRDAKQFISRFNQEAPGKDVHFGQASCHNGAQGGGRDRSATAHGDLHAALICLKDPQLLSQIVLQGLAQTIAQLIKLDVRPVVLLHIGDTHYSNHFALRQQLLEQAGRLSSALLLYNVQSPRPISDAFDQTPSGQVLLQLPDQVLQPLRKGRVPILLSTAYTYMGQLVSLPLREAMESVTVSISDSEKVTAQGASHIHLDRIVIVDHVGGVPSRTRGFGRHIFINLKQEFTEIVAELEDTLDRTRQKDCVDAGRHLENLYVLRDCLERLPPSTSGLIIAPEDAAAASIVSTVKASSTATGAKRPRNALIHNMLTNKPLVSPSLPTGRLQARFEKSDSHVGLIDRGATLVKLGMPLSIVPMPMIGKGFVVPESDVTALRLAEDVRLDLQRLQALLENSFQRSLDMKHYLARIERHVAGVLVAGMYEGAAVLTWEQPAGVSSNLRLVPYLDKFAVLQSSQGSSGVADILFQAMVRTCFPGGVCWRSRQTNPVNRWYFERAAGFWRIPNSEWTLFWTGSDLVQTAERFGDLISVCQHIESSFTS